VDVKARHLSEELRTRIVVLAGVALTLVGGGVAYLAGDHALARVVWAVGVTVVLVPLCIDVARSLLRGDLGVDAVALLAMAGALAVGEFLAAAVIALMLSGGNALESSANRRARRELTRLLERAPRIAHRRTAGGLEEIGVDEVAVGDVLVVRPGDVVPVDGVVAEEVAVLDESALTGEPLPVAYDAGGPVRSGAVNAGGPFVLRALRPAAESSYAGIVRLVRAAETEQAPFVRLADRYAIVFLGLTVALAGAAWLVSGDPVRAVAVLVVATPCPLILAAPIAFICGVSRAAHRGVIVKGGATIERLGRARTVLLDKTGTVTRGTPEVEAIVPLDGYEEADVLGLAAAVDAYSAHVMAEALTHEAERRGIALAPASAVHELAGVGVHGLVDGRHVAVGGPAALRAAGVAERQLPAGLEPEAAGRARVLVGVDGTLVGAIVLADHVREDAPGAIAALRAAGIRHVAIVSGDRESVARGVGDALGADAVYAEQSPAEKLDVVRAVVSNPELAPVVMVGDGVNDAPALALADVGIAMAGQGATVSSETADAVIVVDRVDRVAEAVAIGRRSLAIARQSVLAGIGLSVLAMVVAALGGLPPVGGALLQEAIDVAVILNALRALTGP
jgi:heavy metal translocating P-type ATPase